MPGSKDVLRKSGSTQEVRMYSRSKEDGHLSEGHTSKVKKVPHGQKWKISGKKIIKYYQIVTTV